MTRVVNGVAVFGTAEPVPEPLRVAVGPLSLELIQGVARALRWQDVEVVRGIDCVVRDDQWATYASKTTHESVHADANNFEVVHERVIVPGLLSGRLVFAGHSDGFFRASAELTAVGNVCTNRAGFIVLHPLDGLLGTPITVLRSDGSSEVTVCPTPISPGQLAFDIASLAYSLFGVEVTIQFKGDIFEMEDQRNWSDASFKTYCHPLSLPLPHTIVAGETRRQEVEIRLKGSSRRSVGSSTGSARNKLRLNQSNERLPTIALAIDADFIPNADELQMMRIISPRALQLRVRPDTADLVFKSVRDFAEEDHRQVELEMVVPLECNLEQCLADIAERTQRHALTVSRVLALPERYLQSYQPHGLWPSGATPREACIAARKHFPHAQIGGGVLTHFAELNRCRPDLALCDYVSHGSTAILHAADDRSVVETLEGLSHVFGSARELAGDRDYRLGLVSIGMRSNPHGSEVAPNPEQIRVPMARIDPRQRGLFAAAWSVGAVAATEGHRVASLALAAPAGPFGAIYRRASWPQPLFDDLPGRAVYPLFHVVHALTRMADEPRLIVDTGSRDVAGVASAKEDGSVSLLLANLTDHPYRTELPRPGWVRRLDANTLEAAITHPDWLCASEAEHGSDIRLGAFNVALVEMGGTGS